MTNALQDALTKQTRQAIFSAIAKKADEKMVPVLDIAIDEIASREAEIAELVAALEMIAWSNDSEWQADCAKSALAKVRKP